MFSKFQSFSVIFKSISVIFSRFRSFSPIFSSSHSYLRSTFKTRILKFRSNSRKSILVIKRIHFSTCRLWLLSVFAKPPHVIVTCMVLFSKPWNILIGAYQSETKALYHQVIRSSGFFLSHAKNITYFVWATRYTFFVDDSTW